MNVRIVPRHAPNRTDLYGGIGTLKTDPTGEWLVFFRLRFRSAFRLPMKDVAEILLDDEPGDFF